MNKISKELLQSNNTHIYTQNETLDLTRVDSLPILDITQPTLVFDFDGVITSPQNHKAKVLQSMGYQLDPSDTDGPKAKTIMLTQFPDKGTSGVTRDYEDMIFELYVQKMSEIPPENLAIEVINELYDSQQFNIVILTSRKTDSAHPEVQSAGMWLKQHQLKVDIVVATNNQAKTQILNQLNPALFVDDSIDKLAEVFIDPQTCNIKPEGLLKTKICLFRQLANGQVDPKGDVEVITQGWNEIRSIANSFIK